MTSCLFPNIYVLGVNAKLRKAPVSFVKPGSLFGCSSSWNNSAPAWDICIKLYVGWKTTIVRGKHASLVKADSNNTHFTWRQRIFTTTSATAGYTWTDYKTNTQITKQLKITPILDKLFEYKRNWIQHVNRMPRNRLPRVMKHYSPTGRRNRGRPLNRLLDTWDRNGSTSGPTPWQIYYDDDDDDDDDDDEDDFGYWLTTAAVGSNNNECKWHYTDCIPSYDLH
jgi:hypothetical protein